MIVDFALVLFIALVITGLIWLADRLFFQRARAERAETLKREGASAERVEDEARESLLVEYSRSFFPVILVVFLLRSFLVEPFRIPSESMLPTLLVGDFILVNKFTYGIRLPIANKKIIGIHEPRRGDVMVFRYPENPSENYIKRVIGLPGDHVAYHDKRLTINGTPIPVAPDAPTPYLPLKRMDLTEYQENLFGVKHEILLSNDFDQRGGDYVVPQGYYFVMGDNRDYSNDSRSWGLVPEANIVGRAFLIWFSWDAAHGGGVNWSRIGMKIQ